MNPLERLRAWFAEHQRQVLIAAGVGVGGFALYRVHQNGGFGSSSDASGSSVSPDVAGLTAAPTDTTSSVDPYGDISTELSSISSILKKRLPVPKATKPKTPTPPAPLPKPGTGQYTIRKGDTLAKISQAVYGEVTNQTVNRIKLRNPVLMSFAQTASLNFFAGHRIVIPKAPAPSKSKPRPKPVKKKTYPHSGPTAPKPKKKR